MTDRYDLLVNSIHASDLFITHMFLFALAAVIAYPVLGWTPAWMRTWSQRVYLACMLLAFIFVTVASWQ